VETAFAAEQLGLIGEPEARLCHFQEPGPSMALAQPLRQANVFFCFFSILGRCAQSHFPLLGVEMDTLTTGGD